MDPLQKLQKNNQEKSLHVLLVAFMIVNLHCHFSAYSKADIFVATSWKALWPIQRPWPTTPSGARAADGSNSQWYPRLSGACPTSSDHNRFPARETWWRSRARRCVCRRRFSPPRACAPILGWRQPLRRRSVRRIHFPPGLTKLILQRSGAFVRFLCLFCYVVAYIQILRLLSQQRLQKGIFQLVVVFRLLGLACTNCALFSVWSLKTKFPPLKSTPFELR